MRNQLAKFSMLFLFVVLAISIQAQERQVDFFNGISTGGNVSVKLEKADKQGVKIKMIKGDAKDVITDVSDKTLKVKIKNKWSNSWSGKQTKAKVIVYYTELDDISASAGSSIMSDDVIVANDLDIEASSGASIRLEIKTDELDSGVSSGGSVKLSGNSSTAEFEASSGGSLKARDLIAKDVEAEASSGGSISCHATKSIEAEASSGGSISYDGEPKSVEIDSGRSGSISGKR